MSAYPTNAREADLMTRKKKPAPPLLDAANPAPAPLTVQDITNKFMGTPPQQVTPAPAFDAQAAARGVEERRAAGNMKLNLRDAYHTEFENQRAAGGITDPTKLAGIRSQMTDANTGDPNGRLRSLVEAQRTGVEGPVYTNAAKQKADLTGQQFTTATNEYGIKGLGYKDATDQSVSQRAVAGNALETARATQGLRNVPGEIQAAGAKNMLDMTTSQSKMETMPSQTRADITANQAREAEMGQTAKNAPAKGAAEASRYGTSVVEDNLKKAQADFEQQRIAAQSGNPAAIAALEKSKIALQQAQVDRDTKIAGAQTQALVGDGANGGGIYQQQLEGQRATAGAQAAEQKRTAARALYGDPSALAAGAAPHLASMKNRVTPMGFGPDPFGLTIGQVSPHLTGAGIDDDANQLNSFESGVVNRLSDYANLDPEGAQQAANELLDQMPVAKNETYTAATGSPAKFAQYAEHLTRVRARLRQLARR